MAGLADDGYVSMSDLADRWVTKAEARANSATDYGFTDGANAYDAKSSLRTAIRLAQSVEAATVSRTNSVKQQMTEDTPDAKACLLPGQRATMEAAFKAAYGSIPDLDKQGSDHYLALQYKSCQKGEIGCFTNRQIISALPDS